MGQWNAISSIDYERALQIQENQSSEELWKIFSTRMYEVQVNDELLKMIGREFVIETSVETNTVECMVGIYENAVNIDTQSDIFRVCNQGIPLYIYEFKSELNYKKYVFTYAWGNPTQFIYLE